MSENKREIEREREGIFYVLSIVYKLESRIRRFFRIRSKNRVLVLFGSGFVVVQIMKKMVLSFI
jgi:hypothetical protein